MQLSRSLAALAPLATLATLAPALASQAQVWTVGPFGTADFIDPQDAIDAAASGDVVLVTQSFSTGFLTIDGKGISLLSTSPSPPHFTSLVVRGVPAGERVVVRDMIFAASWGPPILLEDNQGLIWLEDATYDGFGPPPLFGPASSVIRILQSDSVVLTRADLHGHQGVPFNHAAGQGAVDATGSGLFAFASDLVAGFSVYDDVCDEGAAGTAGVRVADGFAAFRDCRVVAGDGGDGDLFEGPEGGDGGSGLELSDGSEAWAIRTEFAAGEAGFHWSGTPPTPGLPALVDGTSSLNEAPAEGALMTTSAVVRDDVEGENIEISLRTLPDSPCFLLGQLLASTPVLVPSYPDLLATGLAPVVLPAGTTDASGQLELSIDVASIPPGFSTWDVTLQMVAFQEFPEFALSNPSIVTVVDSDG